jgi:GNAT superfamily N-acetyltransferase
MIEVRIAPVAAAQDTALVNELAALVNGVYALAEEGLWVNGTPRTTPERMAELMAAGQIAIAWADERIVGAIRIQRLDTGEGEFGMLVADPAHRGHGVGRELVGSPSTGVASRASTRCSSRSWYRGSGLIRARSS